MITLVLGMMLSVAPPSDTEGLTAPSTRIVLRVGQLLGAQTDRIQLRIGATISEEEAIKIQEAIVRSGLFRVDVASRFQVEVRRTSESRVEVEAFEGDTSLDTFSINWTALATEPPSNPIDTVAAPEPGSLTRRLDTYRQRKLSLRGVDESLSNVNTQLPEGFDPYLNTTGRAGWDTSRSAGFQAPSLVEDDTWVVVQGERNILDERDLALLLNDTRVLERIDNGRRRANRRWTIGFGATGAASLGAGITTLLLADGRSSREALGGSLIGVGVVVGVLALLQDTFYQPQVLSGREALELVTVHNTRLQRELDLSPRELRANPRAPRSSAASSKRDDEP